MRTRFEGMKILQTVSITALLLFSAVSPVMAQNSDTNTRLLRIENEIQTLSRAMFKGEAPPTGFSTDIADPAQANLLTRLDQMESDIRSLTGRVEELDYQVGQIKNIEGRLTALESGSGSTAMTTNSAVMGSATTASGSIRPYVLNAPQPRVDIPEGQGGALDLDAAAAISETTTGHLGQMGASGSVDPVTASYEAAYTMLRNRDYPNAQIAFDQFIKAHPNHALVPNAMYWLGETHYVRGDYQKAAFVFAESYQKYPQGVKAPDNLLKLGMALAAMGKTQDACVALGQLKKEYPAGSVPVLTRGEQERARLGCK